MLPLLENDLGAWFWKEYFLYWEIIWRGNRECLQCGKWNVLFGNICKFFISLWNYPLNRLQNIFFFFFWLIINSFLNSFLFQLLHNFNLEWVRAFRQPQNSVCKFLFPKRILLDLVSLMHFLITSAEVFPVCTL